MAHKFAVGISVYYDGGMASARGVYKIVKQLPIEQASKVVYRTKSPAEAFERTADEGQLSREDS